MSAVGFNEVIKEFSDGSVRAVDRVSFTVEDGELLVLLGPSGCGKTTSLRMIAGLEEPDGGEISIHGKTVSAPAKNVFVPTEKRDIGMVFQSYAIWPHMTVFENVAYPLRVRHKPKQEVRERVEKTLAMIGLQGLENRPATHLSGGQQQRVALARALVFSPNLLLLDEPLSNLDAKLRVHTRTELKMIQRQTGVASVFVTHDQAEAMALADRIIVMNRGHIEQVGSPQEIYERPRTQFVSEFVGTINLLPAEVVGQAQQEGLVRVRMGGAAQEMDCQPAPELSLVAGQSVLVSIRPEKISLVRQGANGHQNVWPCRVKTTEYYGDHREYVVTMDEQDVKVTTPVGVNVEPGTQAFLSCQPEEMILVAREA